MPGIADRYFTVFRRPSADERGILSRQHTIAKQAACSCSELIHTECKRDKTPENSVKLRHEHRCRNALAGDISESEIKIVFTVNDVNIVPADQSGRLITIVHMPTTEPHVMGGQQTTLNFSRELEIVFKSSSLFRIEVINAK